MNKITMKCGCSFETNKAGELIMPTQIEDVNLDCPLVYDTIGQGRTLMGFQIESGLGQTLSKRLKPENIHHLAALIAVMRPSCLKAVLDDGKSITDHFIARKNNEEVAVCPYSALEPILKDTYGLLIFQEQSIRIGQEIAGMTLQQADHYIRYGIGKKKAEIIGEAKKIFLEGCKKLGKVNEREAKEIFEWLESANRYQFNASHSYGYSITTYITMLAKTHFTERAFVSWLNHSKDKIFPMEEIQKLVMDAKAFDIDVLNPDLRNKNTKFLLKGKKIYFGLSYIKEVGEKTTDSILKLINDLDLNNESWAALIFKLLKINKTAIKRLIAVGALDYLKLAREKMLFEHDTLLKLTNKEIEWIEKNVDLQQYSSIEPLFKEILSHDTGKGKPISNKNRKNIINGLHYTLINSPYSVIIDNIERVIALEKSYLGCALTCHSTDLVEKVTADTTCNEFNQGKNGTLKLIVEINRIKTTKTKKSGDEMAFIDMSDQSGALSGAVIFADNWEKYKNILFENNTVLIVGRTSEKGSLTIFEVKQV